MASKSTQKVKRRYQTFIFVIALLLTGVATITIFGQPQNSGESTASTQSEADPLPGPGSELDPKDSVDPGNHAQTDKTTSRLHHQSSAKSGASGRHSYSSKRNHSNDVLQALSRRFHRGPSKVVEDEIELPEWEKVFTPGGRFRDDVDDRGLFGSNGLPDFIDLYAGIEADFIEENLSAGVATDMSALITGRNLADEALYNGAVRAEHDLGNAYVMATIGDDNHLRLYTGVERLLTEHYTYIEIEFLQNPVSLAAGRPWEIIGQRKSGDLLVRMVFNGQSLYSVEFERFQDSSFQFVEGGPGIAGTSCYATEKYEYCLGPPPISHPVENIELWDENFIPVEPIVANGFVDIGIDTDLMAEMNTDYSSVLIRTPEDIAMNTFSVFQRFASNSDSLKSSWHHPTYLNGRVTQ